MKWVHTVISVTKGYSSLIFGKNISFIIMDLDVKNKYNLFARNEKL